MNRIKVLFITGYSPFNQGGAEYQALLLANRLKREMDVSFVFRNHFGKPNIVIDKGFHLYAIKPYRAGRINGGFILETRQLIQILETIQPDVIYIRGGNAYGLAAAHYSRKNKCRTIWHIAHDRDLIPFDFRFIFNRPWDFLNKKWIEYGLTRSDVIIAQTHHQAALVKKNYKCRCEAVIGNWHPIPPDPPQKDMSNVHVLWIANIRPFKQPKVFIHLVRTLGPMPGVRFSMIGKNRQYHGLMASAKASGIDLLGELSNEAVNSLLAKNHLLVNTSQMEGFSNTFIQAWMNRIPVISLKADPDNILQKKRIGKCSGNFAQLVQDTFELIHDSKTRNSMGRNARHHAIQYHSLANLEQMVPFFK